MDEHDLAIDVLADDAIAFVRWLGDDLVELLTIPGLDVVEVDTEPMTAGVPR